MPAVPTSGLLRVRRATADDALIVGALRLQEARASGAAAESGFLDRFAAAWDAGLFPAWVAELDGAHAGVLIAQVCSELPWPSSPPRQALRVVSLYVAPSAPAGGGGGSGGDRSGGGMARRSEVRQVLVEHMTTWARAAAVRVPETA